MLDNFNTLKNKIITMNSSNHGEPTEEFSPINLEILLSESIVESTSDCTNECDNDEKEKRIFDGGFKLTGNPMSLKLNDVEYETTPDLVHFILNGSGVEDGGQGIFRRHFSKFNHSTDQKKLISEKVVGDLVLNFKNKSDIEKDVYLVLPIFYTENSNKNGAEVVKLATGINAGNTKKREKHDLMKSEKEDDDLMGFNRLQVPSNKNMSTNGFRDFETVNLTNMIKTEVPIIHYKINKSIFLIFDLINKCIKICFSWW